MVRLFSGYNFTKLIGLIVLFLILRLPGLWLDFPITNPLVLWQQTGLSVHNGNTLYVDVWTPIAPLAAWLFGLFYYFGLNYGFASQVVVLVVMIFQAIFFNIIIVKFDFLGKRTALPAFIYLIIGACFFDFAHLSPAMLGNSFFLITLWFAGLAYRQPLSDNQHLKMGFSFGIGLLFFLPAILLFLVFLLAFMLFTSSRFRQYFLIALGGILPGLILYVIYFYFGLHLDFFKNYLAGISLFNNYTFYSLNDYVLILLPPLVFLVFAILKFYGGRQSTVYYRRYFGTTMILWLVVGVIVPLFSPHPHPAQYIIVFPALSYFGSIFIISIKKNWRAETIILLFSSLSLTSFYGSANGFLHQFPYSWLTSVQNKKYIAVSDMNYFSGKKMLVIGDDISLYHGNIASTKFLYWHLAEPLFKKTDKYFVLVELSNQIQNHKPDVIVDKKGVWPLLQKKINFLAKNYVSTNQSGVFVLKK